MALFHSPSIIRDGLVLYLDAANPRSYIGSGITWNDLSGNGNNGTLTNGPTYSSTNSGFITFDGSNDYISVPQSPTVDITTNTITFGGWVYPNISNKYQHIVVKNVGESRQYGIWLSVNGTSQIFRSLNGVISQGNITLSKPWLVNSWNYIMLVYDGSSIRIFLNGDIVHTQSGLSGNIVNTNSNVNIGGEPSQSYFLNGSISIAKIYNKALTLQELQQNFNAIRGRFGV